ncbi:DUF4215 domain-containing protein [Candidatus Falkowbacteria bacterium]|nr:DUF4215 domain-containing protein [Candidatus Falkowbacteria bacterium]MBT4433489.1 DUF4215 domain-containing protein [Candidatus Falkowbacteria bacterium]
MRTQLTGDFIFYKGENTIIMDTATQCPPETLPNSVDIQKVCLYKIETETLCGDGVLEGAEECDDQNILSGDGCSSTCAIEEVEEQEGQSTSSQEIEGSTNSNGEEQQEGDLQAVAQEEGAIGSGVQAVDGEVLGEQVKAGEEDQGDKETKNDKVCYTDECNASSTCSTCGCWQNWWWLIVLLLLVTGYFAYENYRLRGKNEKPTDSNEGQTNFRQ